MLGWLLQCAVLAAAFDASNYTYNMSVPGFPATYTIYWRTDATTIYLALQVGTTGFIGFGIGEQTVGSMPGADIVYGFVSNGVGQIYDCYAVAKAEPMVDPNQHWILLAAQESSGTTTLEMKRLLVTGDINDRPIVTNTTMLIVVSYGVTDTFQYHGSNRTATAIQFGTGVIPDPIAALVADPTIHSVDILQHYVLDGNITAYVYSQQSGLGMCQNWADLQYGTGSCVGSLIPQYNCTGTVYGVSIAAICEPACGVCTPNVNNTGPFYVVGMEVIANGPTSSHVHHIVLKASDMSAGGATVDVWASAHGSPAFVMPPQCAYKFNASNGIILPFLQTHYDNTAQTDIGSLDTSGVRLYYSLSPRPMECGLLSLGDPDVNLGGGAINGLTQTRFECNSTCTQQIPTPLNVFGSLMHMHGEGKRIYTHLYRNGSYYMQTNAVDFYDSGFQRLTALNFVLLPGDMLQTTCIHWGSPPVDWGIGTPQEMCMEFVYYYPKLPGGTSKCGYPEPAQGPNPAICGAFLGQINIAADVITSFGTGAAMPTPATSGASAALPGVFVWLIAIAVH